MARRSKLKSQLKDHNESIKEKNELASKVLTEDENKDTGDEEVGVMDALKKIVSGPSEEDVQNVEEKKAEEEAKAKAEAEAKKKAEEEAKAKAEAEAKKKAEEEAKAKAEAEAKKKAEEEAKAKAEAEAKERAKKMHELPTYLL